MSRKKTVKINYPPMKALIDKNFHKNNTLFCIAMGFEERTSWVSDLKRNRNLPSPEEAARMCALLNAMPEDILLEQKDIERVRELIAQESEKNDLPKEVGTAKQQLVDTVMELSEQQCEKLMRIIEEVKSGL